jgi:hypothetical protein
MQMLVYFLYFRLKLENFNFGQSYNNLWFGMDIVEEKDYATISEKKIFKFELELVCSSLHRWMRWYRRVHHYLI